MYELKICSTDQQLCPNPPVQPSGEIYNIHPTASDPQTTKGEGSPLPFHTMSIPSPNIFGSGAVRCGVSSDPTKINNGRIRIKAHEKFGRKLSKRWRIQGLPKFFGYPLLPQEREKLRISNLASTFRGSIRTKAH